jgi:methionyl-tRNA formyltransferase
VRTYEQNFTAETFCLYRRQLIAETCFGGRALAGLEMNLSTRHSEHRLDDDRASIPGPGQSLERADDRDAPDTSAPPAATSPKLTIFLITEDDPIYVIEFFRVFFSEHPTAELKLCGITIEQPFHESIGRTLRRMLRFYGYRDTIRQGLRFISARVRRDSINALAASAGVSVVSTRSVNDPEFIQQLRAKAPDVIVSVAAPEIFRPALLNVPRLGCINVHSGRLPHYRGMMPTFWQMLRGEHAITITVHEMAHKLDAGDVLATQSFPLKRSDSLDRVIKGTKREGARLLIRVLRDLRNGQVRPIPLDMADGSYFSFPRPSDVSEFRRQGHRLL